MRRKVLCVTRGSWDVLRHATGWEAPRYSGIPGIASLALPGHSAGGKHRGDNAGAGPHPLHGDGFPRQAGQLSPSPAPAEVPTGAQGGVRPHPSWGREGGRRLPAHWGWERQQPAAVRR